MDLLCYRQLHSPILTKTPWVRQPPGSEKIGCLLIASNLLPCGSPQNGNGEFFRHSSGYEVEVKDATIAAAFRDLAQFWPRGVPIGAIFSDVSQVMDDLLLLHRNNLLELRCIEPAELGVEQTLLNSFERRHRGYTTTPYHTVETVMEGS